MAFDFSIIVPVLNEEKILDKHLSIFSNSLKLKYNFELIVSDGGSNDNTVMIAEKYADKIVVHNENRRQTISEGRNKGAEKAESETLVFLNGDCLPKNPELFLDTIVKFSGHQDEYKYFGACACYVTCFPDEYFWKDKVFYTLQNAYVKILLESGIGMGRGECQIIRKSEFMKVNGYDPDLVAGEDFDLFRRVIKNCKIKFDDNLIIFESTRRFKKIGYLKTLYYWILNAISVMLLKKSVSKEWEVIR